MAEEVASSEAAAGARVCPGCGGRYAEDVSYCPFDGKPLLLPGLPTPPDLPRVGAVLAGQLELREVCGTGSMGTVFRAWQRSMERNVAVKILRRDLLATATLVRRFYREARAAARLAHPNIVVVHSVGETVEQLPFIVMEYVAGESLAQLCDQRGALPVGRALGIARQIASALVEAHEHEVVHRDLKPANILLQRRRSGGDVVKVVDFGIAKLACEEDTSQLTQTGAIFGTPHFLAPEQAAGVPVDARADFYALGVMLFLMLTGRLPFPNPNGMEVLLQHLHDPPPRPRELAPHLTPELEALVLRALAKDPQQRWPTAVALHDALLALEPGAALALEESGRSTEPSAGSNAGRSGGDAIDDAAGASYDLSRPWVSRSTWLGSLVLAAALGATAGALAIRAMGGREAATPPAAPLAAPSAAGHLVAGEAGSRPCPSPPPPLPCVAVPRPLPDESSGRRAGAERRQPGSTRAPLPPTRLDATPSSAPPTASGRPAPIAPEPQSVSPPPWLPPLDAAAPAPPLAPLVGPLGPDPATGPSTSAPAAAPAVARPDGGPPGLNPETADRARQDASAD